MFNKYQIGKSYELYYVDTIEINERKYLCVTDGENDYTVAPYDFQLDWPDQISDTLLCYVKSISLSGKPQFVQDRYALLKKRYPLAGENYKFFIRDIRTEQDGSVKGYVLSDAFGITHYIPGGVLKGAHSIGEEIELCLKEITIKEGNNSSLKLSPAAGSARTPVRVALKTVSADIDVVDFEEEDEVEFKTSIVYKAGSSEPDPVGQGKVIMQTIAGFMNKNGGKLLIGVNDNGEIVGIDNDLAILFPDGVSNVHDKYQLVIRNRINTALGPIPNTKVKISFVKGEKSGLEYCLIDIEKADQPVFSFGYHLFVRAGNMTVHLKDSNIISYIIERLGLSYTFQPSIATSAAPEIAGDPVENAPESKTTGIEEIPAAIVPANRPAKNNIIKVHNLADEEKIIGHLYFLAGGACRFISSIQENKPGGVPAYVFRTPIPAGPKNYNLLIFYSQGNTDIVNLETALFETGKNSGKKKDGDIMPGWNSDLKILDAFCINKTPKYPKMVAYVSSLNGKRYIKIHEMSAIAKTPHKSFGSTGNAMLAKGADLLYAVPVSGDMDTRTVLRQKGLIRPDSYKSLCGTPIEKIQGQYLDILKPLFDAFDDVPNTISATPVEPAPAIQPEPVQTPKSTWVYILSEFGDVLKTMRGGEGSAVSNIPPIYESLVDLCKRHFPELEDVKLNFIRFTCPDESFDKLLAIDLMSLIFTKNLPFLSTDKVQDYRGIPVDAVAKGCDITKEAVLSLISDGYIMTDKSQYPLYDPSDIAMVI